MRISTPSAWVFRIFRIPASHVSWTPRTWVPGSACIAPKDRKQSPERRRHRTGCRPRTFHEDMSSTRSERLAQLHAPVNVNPCPIRHGPQSPEPPGPPCPSPPEMQSAMRELRSSSRPRSHGRDSSEDSPLEFHKPVVSRILSPGMFRPDSAAGADGGTIPAKAETRDRREDLLLSLLTDPEIGMGSGDPAA